MSEKISLMRQFSQKLTAHYIVSVTAGILGLAAVMNGIAHRWLLGIGCAVTAIIFVFLSVALKRALMICIAFLIFAVKEDKDETD